MPEWRCPSQRPTGGSKPPELHTSWHFLRVLRYVRFRVSYPSLKYKKFKADTVLFQALKSPSFTTPQAACQPFSGCLQETKKTSGSDQNTQALMTKRLTELHSVPVNPQGTRFLLFLFPSVRFPASCNDELGKREVPIFLKSGLFCCQSSYSEPIGGEALRLFRPRFAIWMELHSCLP